MRKIVIMFIAFSLAWLGHAFAGCYVQDGTFYSKSKSTMVSFAIAMDRKGPGDFEKVNRMVDEGRIKSCTQLSAKVIERDNGIVHVDISGIGKVYIYETFLYCR